MKKILKSLGLAALFAVAAFTAPAQSTISFNPLTVVSSNAWTYWQPTNVVATLYIPAHTLQFTTANWNNSNTVTIPINLGIDTAYSNYPITLTIFTNSVSNGTVTVTTLATNIPFFAQAIVKATNDASTTHAVGIQLVQ